MNVENNNNNHTRAQNLEDFLSEVVIEEFGIDMKQPTAQEAVRSLSTALLYLSGNLAIEDVQRLIYKTLRSDGEGGVLHNDEFDQLSQTEKVRRLQATSNIVGGIADVLAQLD